MTTPRTTRPRRKSSARRARARSPVERRRQEARQRFRQEAHQRATRYYLCDLLECWRHCKNTGCHREHACFGDPYPCFERGVAALSAEDKEWLGGAIKATLNGKGFRGKDELIRRIDEEIAAARRAKPMDHQELLEWLMSELPFLREAAGLAAGPSPSPGPAVVPVPESEESDLVEWSPAIGSSVDPIRSVQAAPAGTNPVSPGTDTTEPALPAAEASPPAAWHWTGPLNPPRAYCDEQGRLIMPDPADVAEYKERLRRGVTLSEIEGRGRL